MLEIPSQLQEHLQSGATNLCRCWLVSPQNGADIGFTDHDGDLQFDGVTFRAATGLTAYAVERATGLSVDNSQVMGALTGAGITEEDIAAGVFDGADVRQWVVRWDDPSQRVQTFRAKIGRVTRTGAAFEAELRGLSDALNKPVGRVIARGCDADLGGARCGVDLSRPEFQVQVEVTSVANERVFEVDASEGHAEGWFDGGHAEWLSGANAGARLHVKRDTLQTRSRKLELWGSPPKPVGVGDTLRLRAGCDRSAKACRVKFDNLINFKGFPFIPGEDWSTSYATQGGQNDGSSLFG